MYCSSHDNIIPRKSTCVSFDREQMLGANLERGTAVSNATSNSFITAVCLQITDPVFHLRQDLILLQPEMPLYHLPFTIVNIKCTLLHWSMETTTISFCVTNLSQVTVYPDSARTLPRGTVGLLFLYMTNSFPPVPF